MRRSLSVIGARAGALRRFLEGHALLARLPAPRVAATSAAGAVRRAAALETRLDVRIVEGRDATLRADPDQLEQLLINLIRNAADASLAAGGAVSIGWDVRPLLHHEAAGLRNRARPLPPDRRGARGDAPAREPGRRGGLPRFLGWEAEKLEAVSVDSAGPGNVVTLEIASGAVSEVFAGFGEKGVSAEAVAEKVAREARDYLASGVPVGEHLADQLLIPLALAGSGAFLTTPLSRHATTNIEVIQAFLPVRFGVEADEKGNRVVRLLT